MPGARRAGDPPSPVTSRMRCSRYGIQSSSACASAAWVARWVRPPRHRSCASRVRTQVFGAAEAGEDVVAPPPVAAAATGGLPERGRAAGDADRAPRAHRRRARGRPLPRRLRRGLFGAAGDGPRAEGCGRARRAAPLDAHEDATPMASTDSGEAANMEIRLLTGLDGERPAADMPVSLRRSARTGWRSSACGTRRSVRSWTSPASRGSCSCGRPRRSAPRRGTAPRGRRAAAGGHAGVVAPRRPRRAVVAGVPGVRRARRGATAGRPELGGAHARRR